VPDQRARPAREREEVHGQMAAAGGRNTVNFSGNKGIAVQGERSANLQAM